MMRVEERAIAFDCCGVTLVGVIHIPERPRRRGVLPIIANAPQYRTGCCRQMVQFARSLASSGTPVMRFDYRGLGDAVSEPVGLERGKDIEAAIDQFLREVPEMEEIVLFGGCDGATATAINGWRNSRVTGWILNNPWVRTEDVRARALVKHYYWQRLGERGFWRKLLRFDVNVRESMSSLLSALKASLTSRSSVRPTVSDPFDPARPFTERMLEGWRRFDGRVLLLSSEHSLLSKEFDECVAGSAEWQAVVERDNVERQVIKGADHNFSRPDARTAVFKAVSKWLSTWPDDAAR